MIPAFIQCYQNKRFKIFITYIWFIDNKERQVCSDIFHCVYHERVCICMQSLSFFTSGKSTIGHRAKNFVFRWRISVVNKNQSKANVFALKTCKLFIWMNDGVWAFRFLSLLWNTSALSNLLFWFDILWNSSSGESYYLCICGVKQITFMNQVWKVL